MQVLDLGPERVVEDTPTAAPAPPAPPVPPAPLGSPGDPCVDDHVVWTRRAGDPATQHQRTTAPDGEGGLFVSGSFNATIDLGGGNHFSQGSSDTYLVRYDREGRYLWSRVFGDPKAQGGMWLAPTPDGGVVMAGDLVGVVDFGDGPHTAGGTDAVVARFDAEGNLLWSRSFGGPGLQSVRDVAVDPDTGATYVTGPFHQFIDFGGGAFTTSGHANMFVARLDHNGDHVWSRHLKSAANGYGNGIAVREGRVVVAGSVDGDADLGQGLLDSAGDGLPDAWVALFDTDGAPIWTHLYADPGDESFRSAAFDPTGHIALGGVFLGSMVLGPFSESAPLSGFVVKLTPGGVPDRLESFPGLVGAFRVAATPDGDVALTGIFGGGLQIGDDILTADGIDDGVLVMLDAALEPRWHVVLRSTENVSFGGLSVDTDGTLWSSGSFSGSAQMGSCSVYESAGELDVMFARLRP